MAAARPRFSLLHLVLVALLLPAQRPLCLAGKQLDRRFAERKRCADPECSMLMCRGKAMEDFKGPDCRFVNLKEGEAVYVYYKLIGKSTELWAGSVGSEFGYFPKDLLELNYIYTNDELELPTDETDFVCFDGGKDDFDNYNVDDLLKSAEETVVNRGVEFNAPGTEVVEETKKEEETEGADTIKPHNVSKTDLLEPGPEENKEVLTKTEEKGSFLYENTENVQKSLESERDDLSINSHEKKSQGDQIAHQHSEEMIKEKLKVLESENAKNSNNPQDTAKESDKESKEIDAYTLLNRELSMDLKTKFGSTADAVVSDDEITSFVTSLEDDSNEDSNTDSHDPELLEDFKEQSEEIPLLSLTKEETTSLVDSEAEKQSADKHADLESQKNKPYETIKDAAELITPRNNEKKDDLGLTTTVGDTIFSALREGARTNDDTDVDKSDSLEEKEKEDEVISVIEEKTSIAHLEDLTEDNHLKKDKHVIDSQDSKEKTNKTKQYEREFMEDVTESFTEELHGTAIHDPSAISSPESKPSIEEKQEALKPPVSNIKDDPEEITVHQILKNKEKAEEEILEESLENDTKQKTLWKKIKNKKVAGDQQFMNFLPEPPKELKSASQSEEGVIDLLEDKREHETSATEKQDVEDFEQTRVPEHENQTNVAIKEETEILRERVKETPAKEDDLNNPHMSKAAVEQSIQQENKTRYLEEGAEQALSRNIGKKTLEKNTGEISHDEISTETTQDIDTETQQDTAYNKNEDKDKALGIVIVGEKTAKPEFQYEELEVEEDDDLSQEEEELLEDDNAASAKLSKESLANGWGNKLDEESTNPELEIPDGPFSGTTNPVYKTDEIGEEANTTFKHAGKSSMQDLSETKNEEEDIQISEAKLNEMEENEESSETEETLVASEVEEEDERTLPNDKSIEAVDSKNNFNQTEDPLQQDLVQKDLKDILKQTGPADTPVTSHEDVEPEYSEAIKQLTIIKEFLDEKQVARLQKYLGPQPIIRVEAMFHNMKLELELARKSNRDHEDIEQALDQILTISESSIIDTVENILDTRQEENKEEVVKEIDLWDEEGALMDDVQELLYSLRHKYSPASESTPLASIPEHEKGYSMQGTDTVKETEYDSHPLGSPSSAEEIDQKFPQDDDERPIQHTEDEEEEGEALKLREPELDTNLLEELKLLDKKEIQEILDTEKRLPLVDMSHGPVQNDREDFAAGIVVTTADDAAKTENPHLEAGPAAPHVLATLNDAVVVAKENMRPFTDILVATLPEDIRPGPDFHGLPWEPIIFTALVGIATLGILFWRTCLSVKSRIYQVTEKQLAEKIKNLLQEKTKILERMSEYDQKINEAKESVKVAQKQNTSLSNEAAGLKDVIKGLEETNHLLDDRVRNLHTMLQTERQQNVKKEDKIFEMQKSLEKLKEVITLHSVELSEVQIALNEAKLSEEKVKSELRHVQEENARLKKRKEQLLQEAEGWSERHTELSEQIRLYQKSQKDIEEALAYKENEIEVLTNCIMQLKQFDTDFEGKKDEEGIGWETGDDLANGELPDNRSEKMKNQIKQMMDVSRVKTTLSIVEEDRDHLQSKLSDEIAARHELEEQIKKLEHDSCALQTAKARFENECKTLQQKVEILNELYQQKEMALQKKLTQEEYERQEKEQKLSAADEKAVLAVEEVKVYKQRILEMEEELKKTERSYKNQIAGHEKKAHDNWLIARSAERALAEEKREAANLRQKLIEVNQKIAMLQRPLIVKPTAGRPDRQVPARRGPLSHDGSFGPSPVSGGGPSPPLMMEAPGQPLSAMRREGSRSEFGAMVDGPPAPRRPPELSGRSSVPDLGLAAAALVNIGPRTSSPSTAMDGVQNPPIESEAPCVSTVPSSSSEAAAVNLGPKGPPSFPGTPIMTSPVTGPPPPSIRFGALPPPLRGHYGSRPLPLPLVRGPLPPPPRDYLPGPPLGMRDLPPGPLPPPDPRGYVRIPPPFRPGGPPGPRLPPQGLRDYPPLPPPNRDLPPPGPRDYPPAPPCPPSPAGPRDYTHPPEQKP
ncbi:transport and Golgi organization protein 1 homolog isoform X2 [Pelodiscus sinensis]|uniref:transport and Golgi organization protein 1 homolog isoform X2 n=1 Tax=Pelodiscus sinensis TaxID=13735 RepID=UPI003F6B052E